MYKHKWFVSNPYLVHRLKKSLYGLKQPLEIGMPRLMDFCCHWVLFNASLILMFIWSWFMVIWWLFSCMWMTFYTGSSKKEISSLKDAMNHAFSMTDLGLLSQFLGLKSAQTKHGIKVISPSMIWIFWTSSTWNIASQARLPSFQELSLKKQVLLLW